MNQQQEGTSTPFEHYFKEEQVKFTAKVEIPVIPLQITYYITKNQDGHDVIQFSSGLQYYISQNEQQELVYWIDQNNSDLVKTLVQQLNAIPADQQQQQAQQEIRHLIIEIVDVTRKQNFSGSLSEEKISTITSEQQDSESVLEFVKDNIEAALNPTSSFYIKLDKDVCEITIKIQQVTQKKNAQRKEFILQVPMVKQEVNEQVIENIKEQTLQEKINEQISQVRQEIEQLNQQVQTQNPKILELEQRIAQQEQTLNDRLKNIELSQNSYLAAQKELSNLIESQSIKIQVQEATITELQKQTLSLQEKLLQTEKNSEFIQQSLQKQLTEQNEQQQVSMQQLYQQIIQTVQKPKPTQIQVNKLLKKEQDVVQCNLYLTPVQNEDFTELEFVIEDEEAEYSIGILEGGELDNLENRVRAFFFDFPDGKLTRGAEESLRFLPRQILRNDRFGIRVDKTQSKLIVTLNGQELPPVNLRADFGAFSFALKTEKEITEIFSADQDY